MKYLYKSKSELVIYGDINTDYLTASYHKQCLGSILTSSNFISIADFATRIQNYASTVISIICIGSSRKDCIYIEAVIDGLSDNYAKLLIKQI
jgi:hypothetical protein